MLRKSTMRRSGGSLGARHPCVEFKELFEPLGVILEPATDVDAFQHLVVALMRMAQVFRHFPGS